MQRRHEVTVMGVKAGPVRLTPLGAALVALAFALPGGLVLLLGELVWRWMTGG